MKRLSTALLTAALCAASTLWAELKYIACDLKNPTTEPTAVSAENIKDAKYHTGSTMLFVQDTSISETYYIGVFEVTVAQAEALGWLKTTSASGTAYATASTDSGYNFSSAHSLSLPFSFPTVAQWTAYAEGTIASCNVYYDDVDPSSLETWYSALSNRTANGHGVFDIFGNVAEYTTDAQEFYGGFAHSNCTYSSLVTDAGITHATAAAITGITDTGTPRLGVRLIYTPPALQEYTVTVTHNGQTVSTRSCTRGEMVTVTPPEIPAGYRVDACTITPASITETTFTMPEEHVVFAYTSKPCITLTVIGGTADKTEVVEGETVTLTPKPGAYQFFNSWTLPGGSVSTTPDYELTIGKITADEAGSTRTCTATFDTCPRVLIYSGSAKVNAAGTAYGESYYAPGSILTLTASTVPGYKLTGWTITTDGTTTLSGNTVTVGAYNTADAVLSPVYAIDDTKPVTNSDITHIGETETRDGSETVYSARTAIGYIAGETLTRTAAGNSFIWYTTVPADKAYAVLDTLTKALVYADAPPSGSKTTAPTLKRIALGDEQPYYVGIYETTIAHTLAVKEAAGKTLTETEKADLGNTMPRVDINGTTHYATYLADLAAAFGTTFTLPTVAQIKGITRAGLGTDKDGNPETYVGTGCRDPKITDDMIFCGKQNANKYQASGLTDCDPYGFYDLWGNVAEMIAEGETNGVPYGSLLGGHCGNPKTLCHLDATPPDTFPNGENNIPGAFRPAATVPKKFTVTIAGINEPFAVLPDQKILLAPQMKAGKTFTGWQATVGDTTTDIAQDTETGRYPYTVTKDVKLTPVFSEEVPMITLAYTNCTGPEKALPGSTTAVYATTPGYKLLSLTVTPAAAADAINVAAGTVTFAAEATGAVTVTATYDIPDPAKPGYRFTLR